MLVCAFGGLWTEMYGYICTYVHMFSGLLFWIKYMENFCSIVKHKFVKVQSPLVIESTARVRVTSVFQPFPPHKAFNLVPAGTNPSNQG